MQNTIGKIKLYFKNNVTAQDGEKQLNRNRICRI